MWSTVENAGAAVLMLVAAALAGCAADPAPGDDSAQDLPGPDDGPGGPGEEGAGTTAPPESASPLLRSSDCQGQVVYVPVDVADARAVLPDGLEPASFGGLLGADDPATATAYSLIFRCQSAGGDDWNTTETGFGWWGLSVASQEHFPAGIGYTWHAFVTDNDAVAQQAQGLGLPVTEGSVSYALAENPVGRQGTAHSTGGGASLTSDLVGLGPPQDVAGWDVRFLFVQDGAILGGADIQVESLMMAEAAGTLMGEAPGLSTMAAAGLGGHAEWEGLAQTITWLLPGALAEVD